MPDAILATGMAGVAHWSAAIERISDESQADGIVWDIACRIRKESKVEPPRLQSSYRLGPQVIPHIEPNRKLRLTIGECHCFLSILPTDPDELPAAIVSEQIEPAKSAPFTQITVARTAPADQPPQTIRWKYHLGFA